MKIQTSVKSRVLTVSLALTVALGAVSVGAGLMPQASAAIRLRGSVTQAVRQADYQFQIGNLEQSERLYTQAVKNNPRDPKAKAGLAIVQASLFKLGAAEKNADEAIRLSGKEPYAYMAKGLILKNRTASSNMVYREQREQLLDQSIDMFKKALSLDDDNPDAYNQLGEVYRMKGMLGEAGEAFEKAAELDPDYSEALANLGTAKQARGDLNEAMKLYQRAISLNSKNFKAHYYLGDAMLSKGDTSGALKSLNTALYLNRNSAPVLQKMGEALALQGNEAAAISNFRKAINSDPEYLPAYEALSDVLSSRGDEELAMSELKSALNNNPASVPFMVATGNLALKVNKPEQALEYYRKALAESPNDPDVLKGLAQAYYKVAENTTASESMMGPDVLVDAEEALERAAMANPNDISLRLALLKLQHASGKSPEARPQLESLASQVPTGVNQKLAVAEARFELGNFGQSDILLRDVLQSMQSDTRQQLALAESLRTYGDLEMASEIYRNVQTLEGNRKAERGLNRINAQKEEANKKLRLAKSVNGVFSKTKKESARDLFQEAANLNPRLPEARLALAKIYNDEGNTGRSIDEYTAYRNLLPESDVKGREKIDRKIQSLKAKLDKQAAATQKATRMAS
ncbi:MAG: tetratricopeptide repeat protein [Vampirovibrionales bacterium]|nr:tetratricopeptide repeat protein [Vampirovibrionales bacterium]